MKTRHPLLGRTVAIALLAATAVARGAVTPYDFTGHWAGGATLMRGSRTLPITAMADFAPGTLPNTFMGSLTVPELPTTCAVLGKLKPNLKVKIRLKDCSNGNRPARLHGTVDPTTQTITGKLVGHKVHGTFTLTKQAAPAGA
jgi:hypothetical protein